MRKGFDGLAGLVQTVLGEDPFSGHLFVFRGRRWHLAKVLWWSGDGYCLYSKRLDRGHFVWPQASEKIEREIEQLELQLEDLEESSSVRIAASAPERGIARPDGGRCLIICRARRSFTS